MDELDKKLMNLLRAKGFSDGAIIERIHELFEDEGYFPLMPDERSAVADYNDGKTMTGQEWYDRFEKELKEVRHPDEYMGDVLIVARKAARLSND